MLIVIIRIRSYQLRASGSKLGFPIQAPGFPRPIRFRSRPPAVKFASGERLLAPSSELPRYVWHRRNT
jgi:hypothetical protein